LMLPCMMAATRWSSYRSSDITLKCRDAHAVGNHGI
jgi:hypothetical protein